jgi:uncharacterized protein YeaO (DUF488 family)/DNA-binding MarR family transcriptional regulator
VEDRREHSSYRDDIVEGVTLPDDAYARLLALRTGLRHFERWSEQQAQAAGLTPAQHQLLLAIRGHADPRGPTIGEVADYLLLRHHSTVGLVDRADVAGLVTRVRDPEDHRVVRLHLTKAGAKALEVLSTLHLEELDRLALQLPRAWQGLAPVQRQHGFPGVPSPAQLLGAPAVDVEIARVYETISKRSARVILVDRLWPRGISRVNAPFQSWVKDVAPSSELRTWYGHKLERFTQFTLRYRGELNQGRPHDALEEIRTQAAKKRIVLVTATTDLEHSGAAVLQAVLSGT